MRLLSVLALCLSVVVTASPGDDNAPAIPSYAKDPNYWRDLAKQKGLSLCIVRAKKHRLDSAPTIMRALNHDCAKDALVVFNSPYYHIATNMTTDKLSNVEIHHFGRFLWTDKIDYWLSVSMPVGFQNQSTVWRGTTGPRTGATCRGAR
ncbi:hypothetical protein NQ176_g3824 [Zarea fungicola]|uniref:Uncharacterized protein n=1 Tax=Zarea fungicola TaxID=93591 RepID=A0ACC1NHZ8_9HYPO|nr:hypothetical protein NQ176_g3824 [Lecanicillium fungicola]